MYPLSAKRTLALLAFFCFVASSVLRADIAELKKYKEAFPGEKPKCAHCHAVAMPKKDGDHSLNAYGQKVAKPTTVDSYKAAGKA